MGTTRINGKHTRIYKIWCDMKTRCYNENSKAYKHYGGRGITMCAEWLNDFIAFNNWAMANGYNDTLTIDRINVNGNYEPLNCRWATVQEQAQNKRYKAIKKEPTKHIDKWTATEIEQLKELYKQGRSQKEIAEILNKSIGSIRNKASRLNIANRNNEYSDYEKEYILKNYGVIPLKEIAEHLKREKTNICRFVRTIKRIL